MKRWIAGFSLLIVIALTSISPVLAALICMQGTVNIANTDTAVALGGTFQHLIIKTSSAAAIVYVDPNNNPATTADFQIDPGGSLNMGMGTNNMVGVSSFHYIGATATGTLSWVAW